MSLVTLHLSLVTCHSSIVILHTSLFLFLFLIIFFSKIEKDENELCVPALPVANEVKKKESLKMRRKQRK